MLTAVLSFTFAFMYVPPTLIPHQGARILLPALPAQIFLTTLTATIVPSAILILSRNTLRGRCSAVEASNTPAWEAC